MTHWLSNVNESIRLDGEAEAKYLNSDFKSAGETYEKAGEYNPLEYSYFENAGISYFQSGYYDKAIKNLTKVIDSLNPGSGKSEFVIAQSYGELGNKTIACEYAIKSGEFDYRESFKLFGETLGIDFQEITSYTNSADLAITDEYGGAFAGTSTANGTISWGYINVSTSWFNYYGSGFGTYSLQTVHH